MPNHLSSDFDLLVLHIQARLRAHLEPNEPPLPFPVFPEPNEVEASHWLEILRKNSFSQNERILLLLALAPQFRPQILDIFAALRTAQNPYSEFGGRIGQQSSGFLPTVETAIFLAAGNEMAQRFEATALLDVDAKLVKSGLIQLEMHKADEPFSATTLLPTAELLDLIQSGIVKAPKFGPSFPARLIETNLNWDSVVLPAKSMRQLDDLQAWMQVSSIVMDDWGMKDRLSPGYKVLFYGPPGTGKTFTAKLLGKNTGRDVFRIDLSTVVSKYIGETEKNLESVFAQAESKGWILFFDEADALFGKRTKVSDAHDRYANQEVSYLLQRLEEFDGTVILATNDKDNIDDAFTRRFQAMIHFPMPGPNERLLIWQNAIPEVLQVESATALEVIAEKYELSGGSIMNIVRYAAMKTALQGSTVLRISDLEMGLRLELQKDGKLLR